MRRKWSLVTRRDGSPNWYENFTVNGHRFRASLETDDREQAEIIAAKKRSDALLGKLTGKKAELTLSQALGRYLLEHGQYLASANDIRRMGKVLLAELGKHKLLHEITPADLAAYAARRRATLSNRSVNASWSTFAPSRAAPELSGASRRPRSIGKMCCWRRPASASMS
jgi:hypothetical protein